MIIILKPDGSQWILETPSFEGEPLQKLIDLTADSDVTIEQIKKAFEHFDPNNLKE